MSTVMNAPVKSPGEASKSAPPPQRKAPWTERINLRMVLFFGVITLLLGYPVYIYLDDTLHNGIYNRGDYTEVNLKKISLFDMDQVNAQNQDIPAEFRALDGKRVLLTGEMVAGQRVAGAGGDFDLVYSIQKCCVVGSPKIQHFIKVTMKPGKRAQFYSGLVNVVGTFHVGIEHDKFGNIASVYRIDAESASPAS